MDTTNWKSELAAYAKMKILIVDDEPANVALLEDMLGEQGYTQLKSTTDSRRVLELCDEFDPDLILLDLFMPMLMDSRFLNLCVPTRARFTCQSSSSRPM